MLRRNIHQPAAYLKEKDFGIKFDPAAVIGIILP